MNKEAYLLGPVVFLNGFRIFRVEGERDFTVTLSLSSDAETLSIVITGGSDVNIDDFDLGMTIQQGGYVEDENGNDMEYDDGIDDPTGSF